MAFKIQRDYPLSLLLNTVLEVLAMESYKKRKTGIQIEREEVKLSLFANGMIIENPKISIQKLLQLINEFKKVAGYEISHLLL